MKLSEVMKSFIQELHFVKVKEYESDGMCEEEAFQAADDYVKAYIEEKADFEYQRNKEDV